MHLSNVNDWPTTPRAKRKPTNTHVMMNARKERTFKGCHGDTTSAAAAVVVSASATSL